MNPYYLMSLLFLFLTLLTAFDASLTSFHLLPMLGGLRWLRVHFITLGALTEVFFGLLPGLVSQGRNHPQNFRWSTWLTLNAGLLILLIGIPLINYPLILAGGSLIFTAALLLANQIRKIQNDQSVPKETGGRQSAKFYLAGLMYLLLGITVGTGLWFGWGQALQIAVPLEVHIHANNWGFMSLVFAGVLIDLYPRLFGRPLASPGAITAIFWLMVTGALGLVSGPWIPSNWLSVPGLILHLAGTLILLKNMLIPHSQRMDQPGFWHLVSAYAWQIAPVLVAPLIVAQVPGFPGVGIEQTAPQALIYGWVLQFGYALIPYLFYRVFLPSNEPRLGGSWFSLWTVHLGSIFLWASIFITPYQSLLHGTAYVFWALSLIPIIRELWQIVQAHLQPERDGELQNLREDVVPGD